jgi:hypothetical protein
MLGLGSFLKFFRKIKPKIKGLKPITSKTDDAVTTDNAVEEPNSLHLIKESVVADASPTLSTL